MVVEGYEVPHEVEEGLIEAMHAGQPFTASELLRRARELGVPQQAVNGGPAHYGPAHRLVDRLLQRERRAGKIRFRKGKWSSTMEKVG